MSTSERIYRMLVLMYPREFREEYGDEMSMLFRAREREGRARLWLQVMGDLLWHAPREHWSMTKQDIRYALRSWRRAPAVPALALTALLLGMGANIAIFSVAHEILMRRLPVPAPEELVSVQEIDTAQAGAPTAVSMPNFLDWQQRSRTLVLAAFSGQMLTWTAAGYPERVEALAPMASFLDVMRVPVQIGRWFTTDEQRLGQHRVVVMGHKFWRTRFGADPNVAGRTLPLNGATYTVIGVAAEHLTVPSEPDLWVPQVVESDAPRGEGYLRVIGRLRPGVSREQAQAEMTSIARALASEYPDSNRDAGIVLSSFQDGLVAVPVRTSLMILLAAAAMVLLIACANVANVLLARTAARRTEMSIRAALGAGVARITRQLLTESLLLSMAGALLGLMVSALLLGIARQLLVNVLPRVESVSLNGTVLAYALGLAIVTGIGFGLAPLWYVSKTRQNDLSRVNTRDERSLVKSGPRTVLVVGQLALTTLLLVGAGLLVQSLLRLQHVPIGFNADSVLTAKMALVRARAANGPAIAAFFSRLTQDLATTPGIKAAGISSAIPLSPGAFTIMKAANDTDQFLTCEWRLVDSGYFQALQVPLLRGRLFGPQDTERAPTVFVISQQTARALYGQEDPIGRPLRLDNGSRGEVIGVVADVRMKNLGEDPERVIYIPPAQFGFFPLFNVVVRTEGAPEAAASLIRSRLKALDPNLAAYDIRSMAYWVEQNSALTRIQTFLISAMGGVGLLLGIVGVYGVMSYLVALRNREFGIRIALGASPKTLPFTVLKQGLRLTLAGVGLGLVAALFLVDRMRTLLFQIDIYDPMTFAAVALVVGAAGLCAVYIPARRAARADPMVVLRSQ